MISVPGYRISEHLYESAHSYTLRARRTKDDLSVIVKVPKDPHPSSRLLGRYKQEAEFAAELAGRPGIIQILGLEQLGDSLALITEDFGGESLKSLLPKRSFPLCEALEIGKRVAASLAEVHASRIIHKDINPANVIYNQENREVRLIDFGISTRLPREHLEFESPEMLEGTLAYISPEQTGRMNRALDFRTDIYSLGATLYHLLSGRLPFEEEDPDKLLLCHLAKLPRPLHEVDRRIPRVISDLVMKLMEKTPERRYQSALGIRFDLEKCLDQFSHQNDMPPFKLGDRDVCTQLLLPQALYGREKETALLLQSIQLMQPSGRIFALISGEAGVGKTSLVKVVSAPLAQMRGFLASGKFDALGRSRPYSGLLDAFRQLCRQLLAKRQEELNSWKARLHAALGPGAQVLVELLPELGLLLDPLPDLPSLPATERQNRLELAIVRFVTVFAQPEHPLVLFLDDLQWADHATFRLVRAILSSTTITSLCLIGVCRADEVGSAHPLTLTLESLDPSRCCQTQIALSPLPFEVLLQFVADTLHAESEATKPLAELLMRKSDGNPFLIREMLEAMYADGLLRADPHSGTWEWNLERIQAYGLTDNAAQLLAKKIHKLEPPVRQGLAVATCLSNPFRLDSLALVLETTPEVVRQCLQPALMTGLLVPLGRNCAGEETLEFQFAHDWILRAAHALLPASEVLALHLRIGWLLLLRFEQKEAGIRIFDAVNHLNLARELLCEQGDRDVVARLNLGAGCQAKSSGAYDIALQYLSLGRELLGTDAWRRCHDPMLALSSEAAEAAFLCGDFAPMHGLIREILENVRSPLERLTAIQVRIQFFMGQNRPEDAIVTAFELLRFFGVNFPQHPSTWRVVISLIWIKLHTSKRQLVRLLLLPRMKNPEINAAIHLMRCIASALYQTDPNRIVVVLKKQFSLLVKFGTNHWSGSVFSSLTVILAGVLGDLDRAYTVGRLSLELNDKLNATAQRSRVLYVYSCFASHCRDHLASTLEILREAYKIGLEHGDLEYSAFSLHIHCQHAFFLGRPLQPLLEEMNTFSESIADLRQVKQHAYNELFRQVALNLVGRSSVPWEPTGEAFVESVGFLQFQEQHDGSGIFAVLFFKMILNYLFHPHQSAVECADEAIRWLPTVRGMFIYTRFFAYDSLVQLASLTRGTWTQKRRIMARIRANQRKLRKRAAYAPENHEHLYYLVEAEQHRVQGHLQSAEEYYKLAIELAREHGFVNDEGLAAERAAEFFLSHEEPHQARLFLRQAHEAYLRWGALAKVQDLEMRFPILQRHERRRDAGHQTVTVTGQIPS